MQRREIDLKARDEEESSFFSLFSLSLRKVKEKERSKTLFFFLFSRSPGPPLSLSAEHRYDQKNLYDKHEELQKKSYAFDGAVENKTRGDKKGLSLLFLSLKFFEKKKMPSIIFNFLLLIRPPRFNKKSLRPPEISVCAGVYLDLLAGVDEEWNHDDGAAGGSFVKGEMLEKNEQVVDEKKSSEKCSKKTSTHVSKVAGFDPPLTVFPLTPGSVSVISNSTVVGGSTEITFPFHVTS